MLAFYGIEDRKTHQQPAHHVEARTYHLPLPLLAPEVADQGRKEEDQGTAATVQGGQEVISFRF